MANRSASAKVWLGLGMCLVLFAGLIWWSHWRGRKTLQAWKARMTAQGERFGIDELAPPPKTNDSNVGELIAAANRLRCHAFNPAYFSSLDFIAPGQARAPWLGTNLAGERGQGPATWAQVAQEMESARDDLDAIHAALKNPAASSVINYRNFGAANVLAMRGVAQWLVCEAIEQMHRNDLSAAQDTLRAVTALARLHRDDLTVVNQMIRVAIAGLAFDAIWPALQVPGWTEPQLEELQSQWQQLEFFRIVPSTMEMERASVVELFDRSRTSGLKQTRRSFAFTTSPGWNIQTLAEDYVIDPLWRVAWSEQDELFYLETMQRVLEALRSGSQHKSWARLSAELTEAKDRFERTLKALDSFRFSLSGMASPNFIKVFETVMRQETQRSLIIAAIALQRYRLRYGKLPPDLASLAPEFLPAVPVDYMNGQPLHYRVEPDGSLRLYSVGLDGKDDGGNPECAAAWKAYSGLFDGRDAVWPRLASSEKQTTRPELEILPLVLFRDAPLPDVIRTLARQADLRVRIDPKVEMESLPPVTIRLENMTALGVLETILKSNRLVLVKHAGTNLVGITTK